MRVTGPERATLPDRPTSVPKFRIPLRGGTKEVILTLALMLVAGLIVQPVASLLRLPVMLLLRRRRRRSSGPSVTGWIDVPLESTPVQVLLTLGVSFILFYGGLSSRHAFSAASRSGSACW